jgi:hypothetical protein
MIPRWQDNACKAMFEVLRDMARLYLHSAELVRVAPYPFPHAVSDRNVGPCLSASRQTHGEIDVAGFGPEFGQGKPRFPQGEFAHTRASYPGSSTTQANLSLALRLGSELRCVLVTGPYFRGGHSCPAASPGLRRACLYRLSAGHASRMAVGRIRPAKASFYRTTSLEIDICLDQQRSRRASCQGV